MHHDWLPYDRSKSYKYLPKAKDVVSQNYTKEKLIITLDDTILPNNSTVVCEKKTACSENPVLYNAMHKEV